MSEQLFHSDQMITIQNDARELEGYYNSKEYILHVTTANLKRLQQEERNNLLKAYTTRFDKKSGTTVKVVIADMLARKYEEGVTHILKLLQSQYDYTRRNPKKYKDIPELLLQEPPIEVEELDEECINYLRANMRAIDRNSYSQQERWYEQFEKDILEWEVRVPSLRGGSTKMAQFHRLDENGNEYTVLEKVSVDDLMLYKDVKRRLEELKYVPVIATWCIPEVKPLVDEPIVRPAIQPIKEHTESIPVVVEQGTPRTPKVWDETYVKRFQPNGNEEYLQKKGSKWVWDVQRGRDGKMFTPVITFGQPEAYVCSTPFGKPKGVSIQHVVLKDEVGSPIIETVEGVDSKPYNRVKTRIIDHTTPLEQVYEGTPFGKWIVIAKTNNSKPLSTKKPKHIKDAIKVAAKAKYTQNK